ncbi:MAG: SusD/RagB family nutrient-binding outer membrane lipoprotein [Flavobacteriaceae bacterium]|nr:SusD/RagB family nutrient-binding outer membrane lipoprotein [Flavobacteriaceae bacterium]
MKTKNNIYLLIILLLSTISCSDYLDINDNPNGAITPPLKGLLSNTTYNTAINVYRLGSVTSFYTQYLASPNKASATDIQERINTDNAWRNLYNIMSDVYDMQRFATESNSYEYVGVAKTLMALNLGMSIDVWGDIPYNQAFSFETITPQYDNDETVYSVIFNLLDEALVEFNKTNEGESLSGSSDFIHGGDIDAWKKTVYALKARFLNHLSSTSQYDETAVMDALSNAYTSNADDAQLTEFQARNPWAGVALSNSNLVLGGWLSEQLVDAMNGTTFGVFDPRLPLITDPLPDGVTYTGTINGDGRAGDGTIQLECYLTTTDFYSNDNAPLMIITNAELKFIMAEVEMRQGNNAEAYSSYLSGIRAHMEKLGVAEADINTYIADPSVSVGDAGISLETIFKEKYIAMFLHPESWVDARRNNYNYTDFTIPENHNLELGGSFIRRFDYPDSEYQRNSNNVPEVTLLSKMWWDQ